MIHKRIYWQPNMTGSMKMEDLRKQKVPPKDGRKRQADVHLLITYNQGNLGDYKEMAETLKREFPDAKIDVDTCVCTKVTDSHYCRGATMIIWRGMLRFKDYEGWYDAEIVHNPPDYIYPE